MCQKTEIAQTSGFGSHDNTFIGEQHNHGLSVSDATQIAFGIFREYYPQLKEELLNSLYSMVIEELNKQETTEIKTPNPRIVVPTLQGASIAEDETIRRLYAKLLASDMNKKVSDNVHPAFVKIIDQMSPTDALLLKKMHEISDSIPLARITFGFDTKYLTNAMPHYFSPYFDELKDVWATSLGVENLSRLNLIHLFEGTINGYDYTQMKDHPFVKINYHLWKAKIPSLEIKVSEYVIQMNDFGKQFIQVCLP